MKLHWRSALALLCVVALIVLPQAFAQSGKIFGGGGYIVFDPTNLAEAILQTAQLVLAVEQLQLQYEHMIEMARSLSFNMTRRYGAVWTPWLTAYPLSDRYGLNGAWGRAAHGSAEFEAGYQQTSETLLEYGAGLDLLGADAAERMKRRVATVERQDGVNIHGLHLFGKTHLHSSELDKKITNLERDILSGSEEFQTVIAQLQLGNAARAQALRVGQDTNKLLASVVLQNLIDSQARRAGEAAAINRHIRSLERMQALDEELTRGTSESLRAFRLP